MSNDSFDPSASGNGPTNPWGKPEQAEPTQQIPTWEAQGQGGQAQAGQGAQGQGSQGQGSQGQGAQGYPSQGRGYPSQGQGYPTQGPGQQGYPSQGGYPNQAGYPTQGQGYPSDGTGGYGAGYGTATAAPGGSGGGNKKPLIIGAGALAGLLLAGGGFMALNGGDKDEEQVAVPASSAPTTAGGEESAGGQESGGTQESAGGQQSDGAEESSGSGQEPVGNPGESANNAEDAVKNFVGAIQKGDSAAMVNAMMSEPSDTTFLTDEMLKQLNAKSPMTDIDVSSSGDTVRLSYSINGKKRSDTIRTYKIGDEYKVGSSIPSVSLYSLKPSDIGLKINGIEATEDQAYLLPGSYELTTSNENYGVSQKTLEVPGFSSHPVVKAKPTLSDKAQTNARSAAQAHLKTCLASKKFDNPECGITTSGKGNARGGGSVTLDPKTISCTVTKGANALDAAKFTPGLSTFTEARADVSMTFKCSAKDAQGNSYYTNQSVYRVTVDTSAKPMKVTFN
ncbi:MULTISPECIES: hypothetical protein [unclassified Luteococcus]|uniref:hypothetical protein n=1 Tax=unclassified Luteococcus TaxID=2639923 RepID=UPI00313E76FE